VIRSPRYPFTTPAPDHPIAAITPLPSSRIRQRTSDNTAMPDTRSAPRGLVIEQAAMLAGNHRAHRVPTPPAAYRPAHRPPGSDRQVIVPSGSTRSSKVTHFPFAMGALDHDKMPVGNAALELDRDPVGDNLRPTLRHLVPHVHLGNPERRGTQPPFANQRAIPP